MTRRSTLRRLTAWLFLTVLWMGSACVLARPASAERQYEGCIASCGVYDVQGVLTEEEVEQANTIIQKTSETIDMYIAVYIYGKETGFGSERQVMQTADDQYDKLFNPQFGVDTDGVLLLINNSTNYDYLSTSGMGQMYFSNDPRDDRVTEMLESITPALKAANYSGAISNFCEELELFYEKGYRKNAFTYDYYTNEYSFVKNGKLVTDDHLPPGYDVDWLPLLSIALLCGCVVGAIVGGIIAISYKGKRPLTPTNYINQQETTFQVRDDYFLREYTTHVRVSSNSGGGGGRGGGSSHHSSGGHSHGGGGHHR